MFISVLCLKNSIPQLKIDFQISLPFPIWCCEEDGWQIVGPYPAISWRPISNSLRPFTFRETRSHTGHLYGFFVNFLIIFLFLDGTSHQKHAVLQYGTPHRDGIFKLLRSPGRESKAVSFFYVKCCRFIKILKHFNGLKRQNQKEKKESRRVGGGGGGVGGWITV